MRARIVLLVALVVALIVPSGASVHLHVVRSQPAEGTVVATSPSELRIWFSEIPLIGMSAITLDGPAGLIALGKVTPRDEQSLSAAVTRTLSDGRYVVSWRTAGDDGHVVRGAVRFTVARLSGVTRVSR